MNFGRYLPAVLMGATVVVQPQVGYLVRGAGRFGLKNQQGAFADFDRSIKLLPDKPKVYMVRVVAHKISGNKQGALADFQKAATLFKQQGDEDGYQSAVNEIKKLQGI
ncbi:MAG: hypothetical protein C4323_00630 [Mastigocladus sp. ERB_26_2]